ncbi:TIGR01777 family oxidoreductase [Nocardioides sp.]|uniref:TIGR01777 family oxidoreductase n=1 Tax=Nocardioides sp. TaxID=35761 RepID=UPI0027361948|nr:TIGR01777 family oxidoreductase [Nocardioides sp.]MDP3894065.1 TIGR01777 family oxidoreductase [Nocardioides sp.]
MRIIVAGSSGFLGSHLVPHLRDHGHEVVRLVRRGTAAPDESIWDPYSSDLDVQVIHGADVVINLAGSPTAGNPHSNKWAAELLRSRVTTTDLLARTIAEAPSPPAFLAGNGISYYGDRGAQVLTEQDPSHGEALLTRVTREWQAATDPAVTAGGRVCILRTAPVLDHRSPPLKQQLPLFRAGLGARLGSGEQYFPIISLRDWVGAVTHLAETPAARGPFNLCCPSTPTNAEFTDALAASVGRKARLVAPSFVLKRAAGAMAPELLGSLRARPAALEESGYTFQDVDVSAVLAAALSD